MFIRETKHAKDTYLTGNFNWELNCNNKCACTGLFGVILCYDENYRGAKIKVLIFDIAVQSIDYAVQPINELHY